MWAHRRALAWPLLRSASPSFCVTSSVTSDTSTDDSKMAISSLYFSPEPQTLHVTGISTGQRRNFQVYSHPVLLHQASPLRGNSDTPTHSLGPKASEFFSSNQTKYNSL